MTDDPTPDGSHEEIDPADEWSAASVDPVAAILDGELDPADERLSALLDGELGPNEDRPDLDEPGTARQVAELRAVADAVGARVPPMPPDLLDAQIARALQALPAVDGAPASLTVARARRRGTLADRLPIVGAAAAFVLVAIGVGAVLLSGGDDADSVADSASVEEADFRADADAGGEEAVAAADVTEAPAAAGAPTSTVAPAPEEAEDEAADGGDAAESEPVEPEADDSLEATPPDEVIELTDECRDDVLESVGAESVIGAVDRFPEPAEVTVQLPDGPIVIVLVDLGLCGTGRDVDPVLGEVDGG